MVFEKYLNEAIKLIEDNISKNYYHFSKQFMNREDIIKNGFKLNFSAEGKYIYFSNSYDEAYDNGIFGIKIQNLDYLNLYDFENYVPKESDIEQYKDSYDGVKYQPIKYSSYNYMIWNIEKLNSLKRERFIYCPYTRAEFTVDSLSIFDCKKIEPYSYIADYSIYGIRSDILDVCPYKYDESLYENVGNNYVFPAKGHYGGYFEILESHKNKPFNILLSKQEINTYVYKIDIKR